jgi:hypothetical protein
MRVLAVLPLAACFAPDVVAGQPCAPDGWCPAPLECQSDHVCRALPPGTPPGTSYGYAFVTSSTVTLATLADPAAADRFCQAAADGVALGGTYVAWLSSGTRNAGDLVRATTFGWVRIDGRLFADSFGNLTAGRVGYPLRVDEHGATVADGTLVLTSTTPEGSFAPGSGDCFTSAPKPAAAGVVDGGTVQWTEHGFDLRCDQPTRLYCLGLDKVAPAPPSDRPAPRAFLSAAIPSGTNGRAFLDLECRTDAMAANYANAARFVAFVPSTTASMLSLLGAGPWPRPDGVIFLDTDRTVRAPLDVTPRMDYLDTQVWGGTTRLDLPAQASDDCQDWEFSGITGVLGRSSRSSVVELVNDGFSGGCFENHNVYCIDP